MDEFKVAFEGLLLEVNVSKDVIMKAASYFLEPNDENLAEFFLASFSEWKKRKNLSMTESLTLKFLNPNMHSHLVSLQEQFKEYEQS